MNTNAEQVVNRLVEHIDTIENNRLKARESGSTFELTDDDKKERDQLMQDVLNALKLSRVELQHKLSIDRTTWDRWRTITSKPHRSHLDALLRFAIQAEKKEELDETLPLPLDMLASSPRSWANLRLVFSLYKWKNVIFKFRQAFYDEATVTEMALLALRGCKIIYIMPKAEEWRENFANQLIRVLGKNYAAKVLSMICVILIEQSRADVEPELGLFNYEDSDPNMRIGFLYDSNLADTQKESDYRPNMYTPLSRTDDHLNDLRHDYASMISRALDEIENRILSDFWSAELTHEDLKGLLQIPLINSTDATQS